MARLGLVVVVGLVVAGCASVPAARTLTPDGPRGPVAWTAEEKSKEVAVRTLRTTEAASFHRVRLLGAEKPHVHDHSDLTVFVLTGSVRVHFADRVVSAEPGDVVEIPLGAPHWAENVATGASEAYVVFTPPLRKDDRRPIVISNTAR